MHKVAIVARPPLMAFYSPDPAMGQTLARLVASLATNGRPGLEEHMSMTWLRFGCSLQAAMADGLAQARGASWLGDRQRYPASVVKLVYLVAAEAWIQRQLIEDGPELRRALADMIQDSGNDATGLVVDLLSGTTSGPALPPQRHQQWVRQRLLVNGWLEGLGWPELQGCNACQKTWSDGPYGRERVFYGERMDNRNCLSTEAVARLLSAVIASDVVSPPACGRMRDLLARSLNPLERAADPENQVDGFLGGGLPPGARLWSKAGWMSQARHDAAYVELEGIDPFVLVVFTEGETCARDGDLLPAITRHLVEACRSEG